MSNYTKLYQFDDLPISQAILSETLSEYSRPNDKISYMMEKGELIPLVRGQYVFANPRNKNIHLPYNIANTMYGVSYVSRYSSMSYHGLLSETVFTVESMTMKRSKTITNDKGTFAYYHLNDSVFPIGIRSINVEKYCTFLMATPEKALCDLIWSSKSFPIENYNDMKYFLEEFIRFDIEYFERADASIFEECLEYGNKKKEVKYFLRLCKEYGS